MEPATNLNNKLDLRERLRALEERIASAAREPTDAEIERENAALRRMPRMFRAPTPQ